MYRSSKKPIENCRSRDFLLRNHSSETHAQVLHESRNLRGLNDRELISVVAEPVQDVTHRLSLVPLDIETVQFDHGLFPQLEE